MLLERTFHFVLKKQVIISLIYGIFGEIKNISVRVERTIWSSESSVIFTPFSPTHLFEIVGKLMEPAPFVLGRSTYTNHKNGVYEFVFHLFKCFLVFFFIAMLVEAFFAKGDEAFF